MIRCVNGCIGCIRSPDRALVPIQVRICMGSCLHERVSFLARRAFSGLTGCVAMSVHTSFEKKNIAFNWPNSPCCYNAPCRSSLVTYGYNTHVSVCPTDTCTHLSLCSSLSLHIGLCISPGGSGSGILGLSIRLPPPPLPVLPVPPGLARLPLPPPPRPRRRRQQRPQRQWGQEARLGAGASQTPVRR